MRIPARRIYRAFKELDRFSDEQCEKLLAYIQQTTSYGLIVIAAVGITIGGSLILLASALNHLVRSTIFSEEMAILMIIMVPSILSLVARDVVLRYYFKLGLEKRLARFRCPSCRYLLLGQRVRSDSVTCPECGSTTKLQTLGLESASDLRPPNVINQNTPPPSD